MAYLDAYTNSSLKSKADLNAKRSNATQSVTAGKPGKM